MPYLVFKNLLHKFISLKRNKHIRLIRTSGRQIHDLVLNPYGDKTNVCLRMYVHMYIHIHSYIATYIHLNNSDWQHPMWAPWHFSQYTYHWFPLSSIMTPLEWQPFMQLIQYMAPCAIWRMYHHLPYKIFYMKIYAWYYQNVISCKYSTLYN